MVQLVSAVLRVIFDTFRAPEKKTQTRAGFEPLKVEQNALVELQIRARTRN